jgi:RNA polymerase sigma-70 factor (ECF subfamily)
VVASVINATTVERIGVTQEFRSALVKLVPRLRRFAYSLTNSQPDADDLVQAACERALRNQESFRVGTRMDSWLYRIIQNLWLDDRRRGTVRGVAVDPEEAGLSDAGRSARLPEDRLMLGQVRAAMETLPEAQRTVLSLVAIEGLSYREAAEVLDVPVGTIMSRLSRARENLLPLVGGEGRVQ